MKKNKYHEGMIFVINLEKEKIIGLIVRRQGRTKRLLGFFWKNEFEDLHNISNLDPSKVMFKGIFSGLGFEIGNWEIIGMLSNWDRVIWRVPEFLKKDYFSEALYAVKYDDDLFYQGERRISLMESKEMFEDGQYGYIALEQMLTRLRSPLVSE